MELDTSAREPNDPECGFVPKLLRTYEADDTKSSAGTGWTIKAAILAATAAPYILPGYEHSNERAYVDAALAYNNPVELCYYEMKRLYAHHKEELFLDIGTGTTKQTLMPSDYYGPFRFWKTAYKVFRSGITDPNPPSRRIQACCNDNSSEKTYYRFEVQLPQNVELPSVYEYKKLKDVVSCVARHNRQPEVKEMVRQVVFRIADVLSDKYFGKGNPDVQHARLRDPCNRVPWPGSSAGVCFFKYVAVFSVYMRACDITRRYPDRDIGFIVFSR
jgi:hypothetical protein